MISRFRNSCVLIKCIFVMLASTVSHQKEFQLDFIFTDKEAGIIGLSNQQPKPQDV